MREYLNQIDALQTAHTHSECIWLKILDQSRRVLNVWFKLEICRESEFDAKLFKTIKVVYCVCYLSTSPSLV